MVDYAEDGFNKGIKFHNPNAKSVCGCGESFNIDDNQEASNTSLKKKIKILPHEEYCPEGITFEINSEETILEACLRNGIRIEHACEMSCACTTCHVHVREGYESLDEAEELEEDYLDKAWGVDPDSRLSCQVIVKDEDLTVEIPKYTINMVSERH
ncbi:MAG: ISC system 2Fe-2S type ferredoxin [Porticoccaceae bacterium]|nr:ISC system 2Fe-2S type ferredoxin [Porticoccaceae bacterium]